MLLACSMGLDVSLKSQTDAATKNTGEFFLVLFCKVKIEMCVFWNVFLLICESYHVGAKLLVVAGV